MAEPVAELFGLLDLDATAWDSKLAKAKLDMKSAAGEMTTSIQGMRSALAGAAHDLEVNYNQPLSAAREAIDALLLRQKLLGKGDQQAVNAVSEEIEKQTAARLRQEAVMNEIEAQIVSNEKKRQAVEAEEAASRQATEDEITAQIESNEARRIAVEKERMAAEAEADRIRLARAEEIQAAQLAAYEREQAAEVEATKAANAIKIKQQQEFAAAAGLVGRGIGGPIGANVGRGLTTGSLLMGGVIAGFAAFELVKWTRQAAEAAQQTENLAGQLGITWKQARELQDVALLAGTSIDTLKQSSGRLAEALSGDAAGGKETVAVLRELGVTGRSSGEIMLNFLKALSGVDDTTKRLAMLREVLGRGSAALEPYVRNAKDFKDLIRDWPDPANLEKTAESFNQLALAWERIKARVAGSGPVQGGVSITKGILGALSDEIDAFGNMRDPLLGKRGPQTAAPSPVDTNIEADTAAQNKRRLEFLSTLEGKQQELQQVTKHIKELRDQLNSPVEILSNKPKEGKLFSEVTERTVQLQHEVAKQRQLQAEIDAPKAASIELEGEVQHSKDMLAAKRAYFDGLEKMHTISAARELQIQLGLVDQEVKQATEALNKRIKIEEQAEGQKGSAEREARIRVERKRISDEAETKRAELRRAADAKEESERKDAVRILDEYGDKHLRNINKLMEDYQELGRLSRIGLVNPDQMAGATSGIQNRIQEEFDAQRRENIGKANSALSALGVTTDSALTKFASLQMDMEEVNKVFSDGSISVRDYTSAVAGLETAMDKFREGKSMREYIQMWERGLISDEELLNARARHSAGRALSRTESDFESGKGSLQDLRRGFNQYRNILDLAPDKGLYENRQQMQQRVFGDQMMNIWRGNGVTSGPIASNPGGVTIAGGNFYMSIHELTERIVYAMKRGGVSSS